MFTKKIQFPEQLFSIKRELARGLNIFNRSQVIKSAQVMAETGLLIPGGIKFIECVVPQVLQQNQSARWLHAINFSQPYTRGSKEFVVFQIRKIFFLKRLRHPHQYNGMSFRCVNSKIRTG